MLYKKSPFKDEFQKYNHDSNQLILKIRETLEKTKKLRNKKDNGIKALLERTNYQ